MHTLAAQRVEIGREGSREGFTFTSTHFGNTIIVQDHAANQLHIKVAHIEHPHTGLTHSGEGFWQNTVQASTIGNALLKLAGFGFELLIAECFVFRLKGIDGDDVALQTF
ncbi:MAG: Uncharacterised protein [Pseudidiomarina mangrovi]|nr:MAG: Uncharacterised protein [Pseudidiomarina mangrovi]